MTNEYYKQRTPIEVFDHEVRVDDTHVAYTKSKYPIPLAAMDQIRTDYDLIRFDGDIVLYHNKNKNVISLSDLLVKQEWSKTEVDIVTAFSMRPIIRYAVEGVIPLEPKGSYFNMCQRICGAKSQITKIVTSVRDIVTAIEDEVGDWDEKRFVRANNTVTGQTFGFNIKPGGISPIWLPLLSKAASSPPHQEASILAYQCMMSHLYTNREQFCSLSIADHELIRAASIVRTLREAYPGSVQYCRALNMAKDAMSDYITGCYKSDAPSNDHAKFLNMKCKRGKNPLVSYENYGEIASERFKRRGKQKSQSKYGKLNSHERSQIEKLFNQSKNATAKGSLELFNDGFKVSGNMTPEQKKSFVRVKLPSFMKSDGDYVELSLEEGFGENIKSFRFTPESFKETRTNRSWINRNINEKYLKTESKGYVSIFQGNEEKHKTRTEALEKFKDSYQYEMDVWQKAKKRKQSKFRKVENEMKQSSDDEKSEIDEKKDLF
jgi:hypothetical protein